MDRSKMKIAQVPHNLGSLNGIGPLGALKPEEGALMFEKIISNIIGIMTIVAAIWFTFQFIVGAIGWLSSGGDKNKLAQAQGKITSGLIGLVIVIAAVFFIQLIGTLLGLPDILKPATFIQDIWK